EVRALAVVGHRERVQAGARVVVAAGEELDRRLASDDRRDVVDPPLRRGVGAEEQRALRGVRVLPEEELVRVLVLLVEQLRVRGVRARDVVIADAALVRLRALMRAVAAAVRVQDDQDMLRAPHAQLARGLLREPFPRRPDLALYPRVRRVLD